MAYFTATQADTFFTTKATEPTGWTGLDAAGKGVFLEMASGRFDALPWTDAYDTQAKRVASTPIEAAFYEYVRYLAERGGRGSQRLHEDPVFNPDDLNALADLPSNVAARVLPFLDTERLGDNQLSTIRIGDQTINFNPQRETAADAAEKFARAESDRARAAYDTARLGEVFTEPEQAVQRPMRPMAFGSTSATAGPGAPGVGGITEAQVRTLIQQALADAGPQGLSTTQVRALIRDFAEEGNTARITASDLSDALADHIEDAIDIEATTWNPATRVLALRSTNGQEKDITIPAGTATSGLTQGEVDGRVRASANAASMTQRGNVELANTTEADAAIGTPAQVAASDNVRAMTPRLVGRLIRDVVPRPAAGDVGSVLGARAVGQTAWIPQATAGDSAGELTSLSALPAPAGHDVGDIVNVNGELWRLAATTEARNEHHGTIEDRTGSEIGDDTFAWEQTPANVDLYVPVSVVGSNPDTTLWVELEVPKHNLYAETGLTRRFRTTLGGTSEVVGAAYWVYTRTGTEAGLESSTAWHGAPFVVTVWMDEAKTQPFNVRASTSRFVVVTRATDTGDAGLDEAAVNALIDPVARAGSTARWGKAKLPADTVYTADLPTVTPRAIGKQMNLISLGRQNQPTSDAFVTGAAPRRLRETDGTANFTLPADARGEFHFEIDFELTAPTSTGFGLVASPTSAADRRQTKSQVIFASEVLGKSAWANTNDRQREGEEIDRFRVYSVATPQADFIFRVQRIETTGEEDEIGITCEYDYMAGNLLSWTAAIRVSWTPSDAVAGGGAASGGLFKSDEQSRIPTGSTQYTFAHGLGGIPDNAWATMTWNATGAAANQGYADGDVMVINAGVHENSATQRYGISLYMDETNLHAAIAAEGLSVINARSRGGAVTRIEPTWGTLHFYAQRGVGGTGSGGGGAGPAPPASGATAEELSVLSTLPSVDAYSVGDIVNINGRLYVLEPGTAQKRNEWRGQLASGAFYISATGRSVDVGVGVAKGLGSSAVAPTGGNLGRLDTVGATGGLLLEDSAGAGWERQLVLPTSIGANRVYLTLAIGTSSYDLDFAHAGSPRTGAQHYTGFSVWATQHDPIPAWQEALQGDESFTLQFFSNSARNAPLNVVPADVTIPNVWRRLEQARPAVRSRGRLIVDTGTLPTAAVLDNTELTGFQLDWRLAGSPQPRGYTANGGAAWSRGYRQYGAPANPTANPPTPENKASFVQFPGNAPDDESGAVFMVEVVSKRDGNEVQRAFLMWGPGSSQEGTGSLADSEVVMHFSGGGFGTYLQPGDQNTPTNLLKPRSLTVRYGVIGGANAGIQVFGNGQVLPPSCTLELYEAGTFLDAA